METNSTKDTVKNKEPDLAQIWPKDHKLFRNKFNILADTSRARYRNSSSYILGGMDALALVLALGLARYVYWLFFKGSPEPNFSLDLSHVWVKHAWLFYGLIPVTLTWFWKAGHYSKRRPYWDDLRDTLRILLAVGMLDAALVFLAKWPVSRLWLGMTWAFALVLLPVFRVLVKRILLDVGVWRQPTVIAGIGPNARRAASAMLSEKLMGYEVIAFIAGPTYAADAGASVDIDSNSIPIFYYSSRLWDLLKELNSPHLVIALEREEEGQQRHLLSEIGESYRNFHIAPPFAEMPLYGTEVERFFRHEVLLLKVRNNLTRLWSKIAKRGFDIVGSSILLILFSPLFIVTACLIKLEDRGPIFYAQERVGRRGRLFKVLKFRSMAVNAHQILLQWLQENPEIKKEYEGNNFKLRKDPRVTKMGRWLRSTSMDELPQLWNVLKGEMSLVGPRPLLEREVERYGPNIHLYRQARPGITGIWQISGRSRTKFSDRSNLDAWYIRNWSLWYDFYILFKTAVVVLRRDGAY